MKPTAFYALLGAGFILIGLVIWWGLSHQVVTEREDSSVPESLPDITAGESVFMSGEHGFFVVYPGSAIVEETLHSAYRIPALWRMGAIATGTPVVTLITYQTSSDHSYPRYYTAAVRIGVSSDPSEVAACERVGNGEEALADVKLGPDTFKAFSFSDAAMMQYLRGTSFRTLRDGKCYAVEQISAGSSYREDKPSIEDIQEEVLRLEHEKLRTIVDSFRFAS